MELRNLNTVYLTKLILNSVSIILLCKHKYNVFKYLGLTSEFTAYVTKYNFEHFTLHIIKFSFNLYSHSHLPLSLSLPVTFPASGLISLIEKHLKMNLKMNDRLKNVNHFEGIQFIHDQFEFSSIKLFNSLNFSNYINYNDQ